MVLNVRALVLAAALVLAVAVVGYGTYAYAEGSAPFGPTDDQWSGVFLTNGQAYFGHFYSAPGEYARLRDVYYVLATQVQTQDPQQANQPLLSLQRLGSEIHGPTRDMRIAKAQILFVEELRADSPLLQAIQQQKNAPPATPRPAATQAPAPPPPAAPATPAPPSPSRTPAPTATR